MTRNKAIFIRVADINDAAAVLLLAQEMAHSFVVSADYWRKIL
jgi:hypothetical protein